jgi:hypothetical protein
MEEDTMTMAKTFSALSLALLLGALGTGTARAQVGLQPPFTEYAAKFSCGTVGKDADDVVGSYATAINIHNPQATIAANFIKKFVIANPEGSAAGRIVIAKDTLKPDVAERVDCTVIDRKLDVAATAHVEGFIIIEIAPLPGTAAAPGVQPLLDVVGIYTARGNTVSGLSVVNYEGKAITK